MDLLSLDVYKSIPELGNNGGVSKYYAYEIQVLLIESKFCSNHVGNEDKFLFTMNCRAKDEVACVAGVKRGIKEGFGLAP